MTRIENVLYTAKVNVTGGREGQAQSDDARLDIKLSPPGSKGAGTNPEQLLAAGWSACFIGAMNRAAAKLQVKLPADVSLHTEIDLGTAADEFFLQARLTVSLPGIDAETARAVVDGAHQICPYSKALRNNIHIELLLA
ncbi:organic hydroperoxide resistance protein [Silvimonas amylolytica]|uniref:Peroxiredoxin n=1 Tax=Silvimonas amylolytica TaxID=449663 RepID=A0ABQ2PT34_9NEIS|nr:organic hydroperoxide resistance protein [Silvimonas amylolytica]GGP28147.1 peroxiredoxin [Silvimonas amylolytica]